MPAKKRLTLTNKHLKPRAPRPAPQRAPRSSEAERIAVAVNVQYAAVSAAIERHTDALLKLADALHYSAEARLESARQESGVLPSILGMFSGMMATEFPGVADYLRTEAEKARRAHLQVVPEPEPTTGRAPGAGGVATTVSLPAAVTPAMGVDVDPEVA